MWDVDPGVSLSPNGFLNKSFYGGRKGGRSVSSRDSRQVHNPSLGVLETLKRKLLVSELRRTPVWSVLPQWFYV